jgi:hypothetical protein
MLQGTVWCRKIPVAFVLKTAVMGSNGEEVGYAAKTIHDLKVKIFADGATRQYARMYANHISKFYKPHPYAAGLQTIVLLRERSSRQFLTGQFPSEVLSDISIWIGRPEKYHHGFAGYENPDHKHAPRLHTS